MSTLQQIDLSKLKVLEQHEWSWVKYTSYELERVEMPTKVKLTTLVVTEENGGGWQGYIAQIGGGSPAPSPPQWRESNRRKSISIRKRYLCIGGRLDGQMATTVDAGSSYAFYIRHTSGRKQKIPSGVLIDKAYIGVRSGLEW